MKTEKSCGVIPIYYDNDELRVVLIKQNNGVIGFPKGHVKINESERETALRECFEETNINVELIEDFKEEITYYMAEFDAYKTVVFFIGEIIQGDITKQESEISEIFICSKEEALDIITFNDMRQLFVKAVAYLEKRRLKNPAN